VVEIGSPVAAADIDNRTFGVTNHLDLRVSGVTIVRLPVFAHHRVVALVSVIVAPALQIDLRWRLVAVLRAHRMVLVVPHRLSVSPSIQRRWGAVIVSHCPAATTRFRRYFFGYYLATAGHWPVVRCFGFRRFPAAV